MENNDNEVVDKVADDNPLLLLRLPLRVLLKLSVWDKEADPERESVEVAVGVPLKLSVEAVAVPVAVESVAVPVAVAVAVGFTVEEDPSLLVAVASLDLVDDSSDFPPGQFLATQSS